MKDLLKMDAFDLLDIYVSAECEGLIGEMDNQDNPIKIMALAGKINGLKMLRHRIITIIADGEQAAQELKDVADPPPAE